MDCGHSRGLNKIKINGHKGSCRVGELLTPSQQRETLPKMLNWLENFYLNSHSSYKVNAVFFSPIGFKREEGKKPPLCPVLLWIHTVSVSCPSSWPYFRFFWTDRERTSVLLSVY